jgi:predicted DNA-binding protein
MDDREAHEFYKNPEHLQIMGPGRRRQAPRLTSMSSVRFAPEVIEAVKEIAFREGIPVGSWIRRLVQRELDEPETVEMAVEGLDEPLRLPADALRAITAAAMPALVKHGSVGLTLGGGRTGAERPRGLIPGSGRKGEPKALRSSLGTRSGGSTFSCSHMSIGGVQSASCGICGPLRRCAA